ncbi:MAG: hypothetical protein H7Y00_03170 [Fimbriimonadaceae bacterium]|nr:hypothetical protein [Chitinophagales bacterium]
MKHLLITALTALLLSACNKNEMDEIASSTEQQLSETDSKTINESLDNAAYIVAMSLKDEDVRAFIKKEASKQFDGDYDILYQSAKTITINGRSLENIFSGNMQGRFSDADVFENIILNVPNFQISVPVHCEEWDSENYIPLVAIAETNVDERSLATIKAYDSDGNIHWIDAQAEPDMPLIAVGISERVDENGVLKYAFEKVNDIALRTNGQNTILGGIRCPTLSHIESVANGKPELRLRVLGGKLYSGSVTPTALTITTKFYNPSRGDINGVWYEPNTSLFNWYIDWDSPNPGSFVYSDEMKFYWIEEDSGPSGTINLGVNLGGTAESSFGIPIGVTGSVSINFKSIDEDLGDGLVYFTDGTSWNVYSTGSELDFELD